MYIGIFVRIYLTRSFIVQKDRLIQSEPLKNPKLKVHF